jgi:hypothetical protein
MIEQAIYGGQDAGGYRFLARSLGFREEWVADAEQLCTGFGERPAGVACTGCVFARPLGRQHVAVVQAADQGQDDAGRPGALAFHLLILPRVQYVELGGDPFFIAEHFPPDWQARGELPSLTWTAGPPPRRDVAMLQKTLNVPHSATLLGGVQILLDGGRLVFERSSPDASILRGLWSLLPTRERSRLWPASFAFRNAHRFDAIVVPRAHGPEYDDYITEEKAGDYPEGRYESNLQSAIETGDQSEVDALLSQDRSRTRRLIVFLLLIVVLLSVALSVLMPATPPPRPKPTTSQATATLELPPAEECPSLDPRERAVLAERLQELAKQQHLDLPRDTSDAGLANALAALNERLGTPDPHRDPGPLRNLGPLQRQLRALLWKHGSADYNARGLNTVELVERLHRRLEQEGKLRK